MMTDVIHIILDTIAVSGSTRGLPYTYQIRVFNRDSPFQRMRA